MVGLAGLLSTTVYADNADRSPATAPVAAVEENPVRETEAEALLAAESLGQPVEVLAFRTEYRDVFAQPDGNLIANEHNQPVRVVQGDAWVPTDATLAQNVDGTITPRAALIDMRISTGGTNPLLVVRKDDQVMTLTWPYTLPAPVLNGDQAVYPEVFKDVDLVVNMTVEGFSHVIVLKTPEAASTPELQGLKLGVTGENLTIQETAEGGVVALDPATGNPVLEADQPTMWDNGTPGGDGGATTTASAQKTTPGTLAAESTTDATVAGETDLETARGPEDSSTVAPMDLSYANGALTLTPDAAMLADPDTNWPVYLDPVWQATTNSSWAMVDSGYPNEEYWKFDGKRHERIGLCPELCNSSKVKRVIYTLSTPYSGKTILSAEFRVTMQHAWNSTPQDAQLYLLPKTINSSTNWSNQPGGSSWSTGANWLDTKAPSSTQSTCTSNNQNAAWNAKEAVQLAAANGWSNVTLGLKAENEGNYQHSKRFCDNAVLSVKYNRAPLIPALSELSSDPGGACVYGSGAPYVWKIPKLSAVLRDPDHSSAHTEQLKAEWRLTWRAPGATADTVRSYPTTLLKASGSIFTLTAPADIPQNVVVSWDVRASDNTSWGPWSSDGTRNPCQFIYDATKPAPPDVDSPDFLPDDADDKGSPDCATDADWHEKLGLVTSFTFDSAATDVVEYRWGFNTNPSSVNSIKPATAGGPSTIQWTPTKEGPWTLNVMAVDKAGLGSSIASCTFRVGKRPPVAQWSYSEVAGSKKAEDSLEGHDAVPGSGVTFGVPGPGGQFDTAVALDGTGNGYLKTTDTQVLDTSRSFTVTAWVRTSDPARRQTIVSQDGTGEPGFSLGTDGGHWVFRIPANDVISLGEWRVFSTGATPTPVTTAWTHLTASYDESTKKISLLVNGSNLYTADRRSQTKSRGAVQFGRRMVKGGYADSWIGELADVALFDRPILSSEANGLKQTALDRAAYWQLNSASGTDSPEFGTKPAMVLGPEASIYKSTFPPTAPMLGSGHLKLLAKSTSYASTTLNANMTSSFTVTARVKLTSSCKGTPMTLFSQKGVHNSSIIVRCNNDGLYELAVPGADTPDAAVQLAPAEDTAPKTITKGDLVALVYNGYTHEFLLYVNATVISSLQLTEPFNATGGLQLGRAFIGDQFREPLSGAIDDVRVYNGVAEKNLLQRLNLTVKEQSDL
ncbi:LamG-like jellyroll fold domain-containing protein [Micromonospora sp. 4G55]|uniref:LamG-like jellyroll fold domain-containing protein n=1 Tax=Micromonospora sp. 4G55 TaxID=2806102 RepID=UPI001A51A51C|nr:LamG-like jellyroll fold domain-containing protein [Micromonospora sp. 4G55]MBM0256347.1 LamG domain-containing protein [Micromonospora sp. 4G55]